MSTFRPRPALGMLATISSRRGLIGWGTAAAVAVTVGGRGPGRTWAQDATPGASPVGSPAASPVASGTGARFAYVGAYTGEAPGGGGAVTAVGISVFAIDGDGALSLVQTVPSENPSFLAVHPSQRYLYAVNEIANFEGRETGSIESYAIDQATGELSLINREDAGGAIPAHLAVDPTGRYLVVGNYVGGNFVVLPIRGDGGLEPVSGTVEQTGSGPNAERQEAPHPHAVVFDPAGGYVATADLGIDQVQVFRLDAANGQLDPNSNVAVAPGAGPRHLAFHPDGRFLYVINELNASVTVFAYDAATGQIGDEVQSISTVPDGFVGTKSTAEIVVHPSGRFVYGSNRGFPDAPAPEANSIVGYAVDPASGELTLVGYTTADIDFPRNFAIDPTGTWLYVCNQQGDTIVQFLIDQATGALTPTGQVTAAPTPVCIVFASA